MNPIEEEFQCQEGRPFLERLARSEVLTGLDEQWWALHKKQCGLCCKDLRVMETLATVFTPGEDVKAKEAELDLLMAAWEPERLVLAARTASPEASSPLAAPDREPPSGTPKRRNGIVLRLAFGTLAAAAAYVLVGPFFKAEIAARRILTGRQTVAQEFEAGSVLRPTAGTDCLKLTSAPISLCVAEGSLVHLDSVLGPGRTVRLERGRIYARLDPLRKGEQFSVQVAGGRVSAIGTAFSVETDGTTSSLEVVEGIVRAEWRERSFLVEAGHRLRSNESQVSALAQENSDQLIAVFAGLPGVRPISPPSSSTPPEAAEASLPAMHEPEGIEENGRKTRAPLSSEPSGNSLATLVSNARKARLEKRFAKAASLYAEVVASSPGSAEGKAALLALGDLELGPLGQAANALTHFERYLKTDGPLRMEGELGRIRAFRALGRTNEELKAIEKFLKEHPGSMHQASLEKRIQGLRSSGSK